MKPPNNHARGQRGPRGGLWSAADDAYLREHRGKQPASVIAARLGRTRTAVIGRAYRLGLCAEKPLAPGYPKGRPHP